MFQAICLQRSSDCSCLTQRHIHCSCVWDRGAEDAFALAALAGDLCKSLGVSHAQIKDSASGTATALKKVYEEHLLPFEQQQARRKLAARLARVEPAAGLDGDASDHMAAQVLEAMLVSGPVGYDEFSEDDPTSDSDEPAPKRQKTNQEVRICIAYRTPQ